MPEMPLETAEDVLAAGLPVPLRPLARIAFDYGWSWQPGGEALWRAVDPERFEACGRNPVRLLREAPRRTLEAAASDPALLDAMARLARALDAERAAPAAAAPPARPEAPIAFLCAEYGIHASLPIYAGGLGVLAGDLLKEASDRRVPFVAVGLLYRRGYFHQRLDPSGMQHEYWTTVTPEQLALERARDAAGAPLSVRVPICARSVEVAIWRAQVGRVPLFLLDSDVPGNAAIDRFITAQLYVGDREYRLMQYALLGIGAVRALSALGIRPAVLHLNEGHPALATLELAREPLARGEPLERALEEVRRRVVFTTHTPVAAGNEAYAPAELAAVLGPYLAALGLGSDEALALGRGTDVSAPQPFGMTDLALRTSRSANGVSRRHGEVARAMWAHHWPGRRLEDVPITHVTNGVHLPTWMAPAMRALLERHLGADLLAGAADPARWAGVDDIPDEELWAVRCRLRAELVAFVRARSVSDRLARGEPIAYVERAARTFDPGVLTSGFARRVASYKRLHLLVADPRRALAIIGGPRPMQTIIAGKAHPRDDAAKTMVQAIFALKGEPFAGDRVVFLEDHDLETARALVAGCDVWVNLPRPPLEASGTSGMKAAVNGGLNLSVLDGWWCEGYDGANGWAIASAPAPDTILQDARDAGAFYTLLEREVIPLFHERDAAGIPRGWVRRVKASLRTLGPAFCTARALGDYVRTVYGGGA
ncbi:alpha-glucan family phosphorylase [Anaeromyxobacter terrae]|uniref:alpha-glucan family phosphorylase n=1 Tax=Anaeromyxobacter terrae TaxID=2925406 RepID=UPI001F56891A|nr:alpha-glucan family phosphorylase [Anaeromyxobacter sp. SG22]